MKKKNRGLGELLFPKVKADDLFCSVESHLERADGILMAIRDVAQAGVDEADEERTNRSFPGAVRAHLVPPRYVPCVNPGTHRRGLPCKAQERI